MTSFEHAREALLALGTAALATPCDAVAWGAFDRALVRDPSARIGEELRLALAAGLRAEAIDPIDVPNLIHRTFASIPVLRRLSTARREGRLADELARPGGTEGLDDPELLLLLAQVRMFGVELELLAVDLRRWLLDAPPSVLPFAQAMAAQCFANEYVYRVSADERARLDALRTAPPSWWGLVIRACYAPLDASAAALAPDEPFARDLVRTQILEPRRERELAAATESFGAIDDAVSIEVRAQYEARPYPRWTIASARSQPLPSSLARPRRMLVAGCGTGKHSLAVARAFPDADVLAIDLSLASIGYARRKAEEARAENLRFRHGDLLHAGDLGETFDAIECVGVLHHLRDPIAGWRALLGVLRPDGWMKVGLYSATARRAVTAMRRELASAGNDDNAIRELRWRLLHDLGSSHARWIAMCADFYDLSECRDLLFHACEHVYTMAEIRRALDELALELVTIAPPAPGVTVRDFEHAEILEATDPDTFARMVQMWVRRS